MDQGSNTGFIDTLFDRYGLLLEYFQGIYSKCYRHEHVLCRLGIQLCDLIKTHMGLKFFETVLLIEPVRRLVIVGLKEYAGKSHLLYLIFRQRKV